MRENQELWDQKLKLNALDTIDWEQSQADLIVLSACQTAIGDTNAANGFAGLALKAGVPSAIGTLWSVNDQSTTELMTSFYGALPDSRTKAQALQNAQISAILCVLTKRRALLSMTEGKMSLKVIKHSAS